MSLTAVAIVQGDKTLRQFATGFVPSVGDRVYFDSKDGEVFYGATVASRYIDYMKDTVFVFLEVENVEGPL